MNARIADDFVTVLVCENVGNDVIALTVECLDYDHYRSLPAGIYSPVVVEGDRHDAGRLCGKTDWNSDLCRAYYRSDALLARVAKL